MNLAIGADHAGFHLKEAIRQYFERREHYFVDCGTFDPFERVDYPDYAKKVCEAVLSHEASFGILVCGTGIGMSIAANKFPGIRAALACYPDMAKLARAHNNANVIALGGRVMGEELAIWCVESFIHSEFDGGRHQLRVDKLDRFIK
ncbi:MAG TPA: ribose 5-phosphate isomerase B [Thermotogota bacterium]|jgi:ribose 5-phosphate isomerase B|nr:ribose 5-phosphate isomerase B [Thermotogota bacterium]NLH20211.1 ribose 5-phosphate isomerase B [Thermotogaceae bacterium]OQC31603.1 MAG: Ribose-5-phosphate isomerase B [Thermotogota bacterium ADurb.Bin062]HNW46785.1 ribose 5-phosphate isomerase B [Thermotogota bacterium]HOD91182.1 ribose 5-phosphate isomerase B [Thermotogota bacterium]